MLARPTVLILGAGASAPQFPTGSTLKSQICQLEEHALSLYSPECRSFQEVFAKSPISSIDSFLEQRQEFQNLGKSAIALCLLPCEDRSKEFGLSPGWYGLLFEALFTG